MTDHDDAKHPPDRCLPLANGGGLWLLGPAVRLPRAPDWRRRAVKQLPATVSGSEP